MTDKNKVLLVLAFMVFLANGDNYAAASMISNIAADLDLNISTAAISVTAYMLSFGLFTLIFGPLSDRFGKVRIINIAAFGTAIFSMLGALAFNLPSLAFFRGMNGLFGSGIFPVTVALAGDLFDGDDRQKSIAKVMGIGFLGSATATAIGGSIAYLTSWRYVYLIYGIAEFILAVVMLKILKRDKAKSRKLDLVSSYKVALSNKKFMSLIVILFLVGFVVLGSFTYSGIRILEVTTLNVLQVGVLLSLFGVGTIMGSRIAVKLRLKFGNYFFIFAGTVGLLSLNLFAMSTSIILMSIGLFGFGLAFIFLQSTIITFAQNQLPTMRGTAMSLAAFNIFLGAAIGTQVNGIIKDNYGTNTVFILAGIIIMVVGIVAFLVNTRIVNKLQSQIES